MQSTFSIGNHLVGAGHPAYIVAELSANHGHSLERAIAIVEAAHAAGADAIKLQTYTADIMTLALDTAPFRVGSGTLWEGRSLHGLYQEAYTPWEWHAPLQQRAHELGIEFFSTAFDATSATFLEELEVPVHKVASFELTDLALVERVAGAGKPLILSTGMASLSEIEAAVQVARGAGAPSLLLLKCTSAYPAPPEEMNLRTIPHLSQAFGVPVGLSDHTQGTAVPVAAVAVGACLIEKHLTLRRSDGGPDSAFSLEPPEFAAMVGAVRTAEAALGSVSYTVTEREAASRVFRRSLFVVEAVKQGEVFTSENVRSIRPGYGLPPAELMGVLGRHAARDLEKGTPLEWEMVG